MVTDSPGKLVYSVEECAKLLGVCRAGLYRACSRGEVPHLTVGRRILIPRRSLETMLDAASNGSQGDG